MLALMFLSCKLHDNWTSCGMCLQGSYRDLLSWLVGPYMIWYMMLLCILVPGQIFPVGRYLIFNFSRCQDIMIPLEALGGYLAYVGYINIKEPRWILGLCHLPPWLENQHGWWKNKTSVRKNPVRAKFQADKIPCIQGKVWLLET